MGVSVFRPDKNQERESQDQEGCRSQGEGKGTHQEDEEGVGQLDNDRT